MKVVGTMFFKDKSLLIDKTRKWTTYQMIGGNCGKAVTIRDEELKSLFVALFNKFLNQSRDDDLIKKKLKM